MHPGYTYIMLKSVLIGVAVLLVAVVESRPHFKESPPYSAVRDEPVTRPLIKSPIQGGPNGTAFDDLEDFHLTPSKIVGVRHINISSGDQVDSIQVTYVLSNGSLFQAPRRGNISHPPVNITLDPEEFITKIEGKTNGGLVDQLTITTRGPDCEMKVLDPLERRVISLSFSKDT